MGRPATPVLAIELGIVIQGVLGCWGTLSTATVPAAAEVTRPVARAPEGEWTEGEAERAGRPQARTQSPDLAAEAILVGGGDSQSTAPGRQPVVPGSKLPTPNDEHSIS